MGSSQSKESTVQTIRYAPYVESYHAELLGSIVSYRDTMLTASPYTNYSFRFIDVDFFGIGYFISSFPSLYDMYGKFLSGLDVEELWNNNLKKFLDPIEVQDYVKEQKKLFDFQIEVKTLPEFQHEMRELNSVTSSSFVIGKSLIESKKLIDINDLAVGAIGKLLSPMDSQLINSLNWNKLVITSYAKIVRDYMADRMTSDTAQYKLVVDNLLWPFTVMNYEQKGLQAIAPKSIQAKRLFASLLKSPTMKAVSILMWTAQGAYIGSYWGPYGTAIGAIVGFVIGVAFTFLD